MSNSIPRFRMCLYRGIALIIIPLCFLLAAEGALRLFHYGYQTDFTVPGKDLGREVYYPNPKFTGFFFSPSLAQTSLPFSIPAAKLPHTYRIFVLGSSAAAGFPEYAFSFSRILEVILQDQFPQVHFEVINVSNVGINSHVIYQIARGVSKYKGDLFILYLGHNEVIGPFGPATVLRPFISNLYFIRLGTWINSLRIGQLMTNMLTRLLPERRSVYEKWKGMQMFQNVRVRADDPRMAYAYRNFKKNLEDIISLTQRSGASLVLCTMAVNLRDIGPFASLHKQPVEEKEWNELYQDGIQWEAKENYDLALRQYAKAELLDDQYAELHFRMARCYMALQNNRLAYGHFMKACDWDALQFRANSRINSIIRQVASGSRSGKVSFLDIADVFQKNSPGGITGNEFLYEHVHMNFPGNYLIAKSIFQCVEEKLPSWVLSTREVHRPLLSQEECGNRLTYYGYQQHECLEAIEVLARNPPFTGLVNHKELAAYLSQQDGALEFYTTGPGLEETVSLCRQALKRNPADPWVHYYLGKALLSLGHPEEAIEHLEFVLQRLPGYYLAKSCLELARGKLYNK